MDVVIVGVIDVVTVGVIEGVCVIVGVMDGVGVTLTKDVQYPLLFK